MENLLGATHDTFHPPPRHPSPMAPPPCRSCSARRRMHSSTRRSTINWLGWGHTQTWTHITRTHITHYTLHITHYTTFTLHITHYLTHSLTRSIARLPWSPSAWPTGCTVCRHCVVTVTVSSLCRHFVVTVSSLLSLSSLCCDCVVKKCM